MSSVSTLAPRVRRRAANPNPPDPVTAYALDVVAGRVVTGRLVRRAAERHLADLATGHERGLSWHPELATAAIDFFGLLHHYKGEWGPGPLHPAGLAVVLTPWEAFVVGALFGWLRADGTRRFRELYLEVARKNGKTLLTAGLMILLTFFDGEPGAEGYAAATKRDQAKLVWNDAKRMIERSPSLASRITTYALSITDESTASIFRPLGQDSGETDIGTNPSVACVDELHVLEERETLTALRTGMSARRQPMLIKITTAGKKRESIWHEERQDAVNVLEGRAVDDSLLALIYTLDEGDDPLDETVWPKANPNLGISVKPEFLREMAAKAARSPSIMTGYLQYHMDIPQQVSTRAVNLSDWDACAADPELEDGDVLFGGLDLASIKDLTALVLIKRTGDELVDVVARFYCPERGIIERSRHDGVPYDEWARDGWLTVTPGETTDYAFVRKDINDLAETYSLFEIGYDPYNATQLAIELREDGANMTAIPQTFPQLSPPWRELDKLIVEHKLRHGGNPILRWMAGNVETVSDPAGNVRPSKASSSERIDGMVALDMAVGRMIAHPEASWEPAVLYGRPR